MRVCFKRQPVAQSLWPKHTRESPLTAHVIHTINHCIQLIDAFTDFWSAKPRQSRATEPSTHMYRAVPRVNNRPRCIMSVTAVTTVYPSHTHILPKIVVTHWLLDICCARVYSPPTVNTYDATTQPTRSPMSHTLRLHHDVRTCLMHSRVFFASRLQYGWIPPRSHAVATSFI